MQTGKTIFIIGAGAIGKTLAVFLQDQGKDVLVIRGRVDESAEYVEDIQVLMSDGAKVKGSIRISGLSHQKRLDGVIVITAKSFANRSIAEKLAGKTGDSPIVVLQNGLDVETAFTELDFPEVHRCVLFASSQYLDEHTLRFKPASFSPIGIIKGSQAALISTIENLENPYLVFKADNNIQPIIWTKTIINSVFNSVCPLLEAHNGIFYKNEKALEIAREIVMECIAVAKTAGIVLDVETVLERLLLISKSSDGQLISTYQDILHKRKTEIRTFNTRIANIAEESGEGASVIRTRLLGGLIEIKEQMVMGNNIYENL